MNGRVVHACLNPTLLEELHKTWPLVICWQHNGQQVVGRDALVMHERQDDAFECRELLMITIHRLRPSLVIDLELMKLHETQRRAHLINTIIEPGGRDVITKTVATVTIPGQTRHAMRAQQFKALSQLVIIGGQHAAFTSGEIFIREKAKAANITNVTALFEDPLTTPILSATRQRHPAAGPWGMCHALHYIQPIPPRQRHDAVHVTGVATVMHHADALG